jgi:hypothetical protein
MAIQGRVYGGQNPLMSAQVYLFAANSGVFTPNASGYGNASKSLLTSTGTNTMLDMSSGPTGGDYYVVTDSGGNFSISSDYTCTGGQEVYLYALGGDPGLGSGTNSAAGLLAALGTCPGITGSLGNTFSSGLFVTMNEVSTIATAYAFAGFATDATDVSSSGTALATTGITNAFANVANMEAIGTGVALAATPGGGTVPQAEINTLADILAACVNSSGPGSTACGTLFGDARSGGSTGTKPTDTATAAINMAHNPGANIAALYALSLPSPPFVGLTSAPNDFTIGLNFTGAGMNGSNAIAVDAAGDVWVVNINVNHISEVSPTGAAITGTSGYSGGGINSAVGIAIDGSADVWLVDSDILHNGITEYTSGGGVVMGSPFTGGGLDNPVDDAFDASGNLWVSNPTGNSLSEFGSNGAAKSPATTGWTGGLSTPRSIAVDASGHIWVANNGNNSLAAYNTGGTLISDYTGGGLNGTEAIAIDGSGNVWAANDGNSTVSEFNSSGVEMSGSTGYTGGGLAQPYAIAVDGNNNVWVANSNPTDNEISELNSAGVAITGSTGYRGGNLDKPIGIAIDGSGDVWVANDTNSSLTEFIGAAGPVVTPIGANLVSPYGSHAVNLP